VFFKVAPPSVALLWLSHAVWLIHDWIFPVAFDAENVYRQGFVYLSDGVASYRFLVILAD
jgi:hypothetical protein